MSTVISTKGFVALLVAWKLNAWAAAGWQRLAAAGILAGAAYALAAWLFMPDEDKRFIRDYLRFEGGA